MKQAGVYKYYVYITTNQTKSVLYIGVTNHMARRLFEHSENIGLRRKSFAAKYRCKFLLYYEEFSWINEAIAREKEIKKWRRQKKLALIKTVNPHLRFLEHLFPYDAP